MGNIIVNGTFAADTDWTKGANWVIAAGVASHTGTTGNLTQTPPINNGALYLCFFDVTAYTSGDLQFLCGGGNTTALLSITGTGSIITELLADDSINNQVGFVSASFVGSIDNVIVRMSNDPGVGANVSLGLGL